MALLNMHWAASKKNSTYNSQLGSLICVLLHKGKGSYGGKGQGKEMETIIWKGFKRKGQKNENREKDERRRRKGWKRER